MSVYRHPARLGARGSLPTWPVDFLALLRLAVPLALTHVTQMAIGLTDTVMLGRFDTTALAASVLGNTVFLFCWFIGQGPAAAVAPMIAQTLGADPNDCAKLRGIVRMGVWAVALTSVPLIAILLFAKPLLIALGQQPELAAAAGQFVLPLAFGLPFALGFQVLRNTVTALSRPRLALHVMVLTVLWNGVGDYVLIFGHFGVPRLGLVGSGIASASSFVFAIFAMAAARELRGYSLWRDFFRPQWTELREIFRLGLSMSVMQIFESALYLFAHLAVGTFGAVAVAAHAIAWNVQTLTSVVPFGFGTAATVRVGLAVGKGDAQGAKCAGYAAFVATSTIMALFGIAMALFAPQIAGLYLTTSAQKTSVIALVVSFLWVAAIYQVADGLQMTAALALRGLKDVRVPMWIIGASFWVIGFPVCIFLAFDASFNALGIWIGMGVAVSVAAAALVARFISASGK